MPGSLLYLDDPRKGWDDWIKRAPKPKGKADFGESAGHPFRGNQWKSGEGEDKSDATRAPIGTTRSEPGHLPPEGKGDTWKQEMETRQRLGAAAERIVNALGQNFEADGVRFQQGSIICDPTQAEHIAASIEQFAKDYPEAANTITSVKMGYNDPGTLASCTQYYEGGGIGPFNRLDFNDHYYRNDAEGIAAREALIADQHTGFHNYDVMEGTVIHELGHVLDNSLMNSPSGTILREVLSDDSDKPNLNKIDELATGLGTYAQVSNKEMFAEAFTQDRLGLDHLSADAQRIVNKAKDDGAPETAVAASGAQPFAAHDDEPTCKGFVSPRAYARGLAAVRASAEEFYSEDQPRDSRGRFGDGESAPAEKPQLSEEAKHAVRQWSGNVYGTRQIQNAADYIVLGKPDEDLPYRLTRDNEWRSYMDSAQAMIDAIREAPPTTEELYRGIRAFDGPSAPPEYAVGQELNFSLGSFSSDKNWGESFSTRGIRDYERPVVFVLEPGARALDTRDYMKGRNENGPFSGVYESELITGGKFEVTKVEPWGGLSGNHDNGSRVTIRQDATP